MGRACGLTVVALALTSLVAPNLAFAGNAWIEWSQNLRYDAAAGETNRVTISFSDGKYHVRDDTAPVSILLGGCTQVDAHEAACPPDVVRYVVVEAGDGDDHVAVASSPEGVWDILRGGAGADTILGGPNVTEAYGEAGADDLDGGEHRDRVFGGPGSDTLQGGAEGDELWGGDDPDHLAGGAGGDFCNVEAGVGYEDGGNDIVVGGPGDDWLAAGTGDDHLSGGEGADRFLGALGNDSIDGGPDADHFTAGAQVFGNDLGADVFVGGSGRDTVEYDRSDGVTVSLDGIANDGNEQDDDAGLRDNVAADVEALVGGRGNDSLSGGSGDDDLRGRDGSDILNGLGGDDRLYDLDAAEADVYRGGAGIDTLDYGFAVLEVRVTLDGLADDGAAGENDDAGSDIENVSGTGGADTLVGNSASNVLTGLGGRDTLAGLGGDDTIVAGSEFAELSGGDGWDVTDFSSLLGDLDLSLDEQANDGPAGAGTGNLASDIEEVVGGAGDDLVVGADGAELLDGWEGDDVLVGGLGADDLLGGEGFDLVSYADRLEGIVAALDGVAGDGAVGEDDFIAEDVEDLAGGSGNDSLTGDPAENFLFGGEGHDTIAPLAGADYVSGDAGADAIAARDGTVDEVDCGPDSDSVVADGSDLFSPDCESVDLPIPPTPPPPPPSPPPPSPPPPSAAPRAVQRCVVPILRGKTLAQARRLLSARKCALGRVKRSFSRIKAGRVIAQSRRPGARLPRRSRVNVVVSRGRRR